MFPSVSYDVNQLVSHVCFVYDIFPFQTKSFNTYPIFGHRDCGRIVYLW